MRTFTLSIILLLLCVGCTSRGAQHRALDDAYDAYSEGNCAKAMLALSQAERYGRLSDPLRPEIALLRGQCLERQGLFPDAVKTYEFLIGRYPNSEYAYRARARLETLQQLGRYPERPHSAATSFPLPVR